jgi:hypothetical protein
MAPACLAQAGGDRNLRRESAFACDRAALNPAARTRHFKELGPALRAAHQRIRELPDGFEFGFPGDTATFRLAAEWAEGEHLCCPFFDIDLRLEREGGLLWLRLTGRDGVKQFIRADFAGWFPQWLKFVPASDLPSFGQAFDSWVSRIEALVVPAADAMPDSLYSFAPGGIGFKACGRSRSRWNTWPPTTIKWLRRRRASKHQPVPGTKARRTRCVPKAISSPT